MNRAGGILLHPTSLPSIFGIGDIGASASKWIDWLAHAGCTHWQVLPLGPVGLDNSPYQSLSAFAGNELLLCPNRLVEDGLLSRSDLSKLPSLPPGFVDFQKMRAVKQPLIEKAAQNFISKPPRQLKDQYNEFVQSQALWLEDYALFMSFHRAQAGLSWVEWPSEVARREPTALRQAGKTFSSEIELSKVLQFLFHSQWIQVKRLAQDKGIHLIGDIPIFVAHQSADVWAHQSLFHLDEDGRPLVVAGVPPDYFSEDGQLWGNPLYRWDIMESDGFTWWVHRLKSLLRWVDGIRLDHFRGFESYWEVPAGADSARVGRWVEGPREKFFEAVSAALGQLPFIAEDLGTITPEVTELRRRFGLPGMKVLHFGFEGGPSNLYLPHNFDEPCVVYTGTHDNDTTLGWYQSADEGTRDYVRRYLSVDGSQVAWDMIRLAWSSTAEWAIVPFQDVLSLASEARMNRPGTVSDNWAWRFTWDQAHEGLSQGLNEMGRMYGRI